MSYAGACANDQRPEIAAKADQVLWSVGCVDHARLDRAVAELTRIEFEAVGQTREDHQRHLSRNG